AYIDLSRSVDLIGVVTTSVSRADGDVHAKGNPHYWLNPLNGLKMAQVITDTLSQHSPQHSTFFASQLLQFNTKLQTAYAQWQTQLSFLQGKKIMTYHTSLDYLAQAFGFSIVAQLEPKPGIAPTAAHLRGLIKTIKQENIHYLLMEQFYEQGSAKLLQRQTDIRVIRIPQSVGANTEINTYTELFESIVSRFQEAH
ncbi:MAG: metal ABC transporter substrate-binding protein, partial [Gammaproteobacteria bacterium]|nr:metal ABC transporter substrate-binding protein [Gammaproteobacteria bacterium]